MFETAQVKLTGWMVPFGGMFTVPTWRRVLVLLIGAVSARDDGPWPQPKWPVLNSEVLAPPRATFDLPAPWGQCLTPPRVRG